MVDKKSKEIEIKEIIHAKGYDIGIYTSDFKNEYISITDIARYKSDMPHDVIKNWMRNRDTIEYLGLWESLHNPNFKPVEFDLFRNEAGLNAFTMSPTKWIKGVNAIGIVTKAGRYGGTYAHSDIALEFASWISAEFKLYIVKDYQRIKKDENNRLSLNWNLNREIAKLNYRIQSEAIRNNLILPELTAEQISFTYASEADLLNVALFGMTAVQWEKDNPEKDCNIRDVASIDQLLVLANLESYNSILIEQGEGQADRLVLLRNMAVGQMKILSELSVNSLQGLSKGDE
ncbi:MAG: KilA-N domain-containing protein [Lachnospiraceae bacterium]|nr:KilA-N domain-containing protein [Lachnospiraceae bacterium]